MPGSRHTTAVNEYTEDELRVALVDADRWSVVNVRLGRSPLARVKPVRDLAVGYGLDVSKLPYQGSARSYTDAELTAAVAAGRSWADVARRLGKANKGGASIAWMRRSADRLGLDVTHLERGYFNAAELTAAVAAAKSWTAVGRRLGKSTDIDSLRRGADRLGLDVTHLPVKNVRRTYTDAELKAAVAAAKSWRDVARRLSKSDKGGTSIARVRRRADRLGLDVSHLVRGHIDAGRLAAAVGSSSSWAEVAQRLGYRSASSTARIRRYADQLGVDVSHLERKRRDSNP